MRYLFPILSLAFVAADGGVLDIVGSSGVPAMHAALLLDGSVMFLDKIENKSTIWLPDGRKAYSSIFDPATSKVTVLDVKTNPFCCGGAFLSDGRLISLGGNDMIPTVDAVVGDGFDGIRYLMPQKDQTTWIEPGNKMASRR
jgi:hypothetical protein